MDRSLALYVSAAPEMDAECERLGQLLADTPRSIRWVIKRTPGPHENANPDLGALAASQFYLILLGTDIVAPVGVELQAARRSGAHVFAYRNVEATPTPAASVFARDVQVAWQGYHSVQEFIQHFERALITQFVEGTPGYGLMLSDLEELSKRLQALEETSPEGAADERRGAGRGGVILPGTPFEG
ncbi:MAG: hypothetical protein FJZ90_15570 [Chloroflexi bacterium]|nr:hypothetical protein [Chloroflexota bacterium]